MSNHAVGNIRKSPGPACIECKDNVIVWEDGEDNETC